VAGFSFLLLGGELFQAYDISTGNFWLMVLVVIAISPFLAARLRGLVP
jgi:hypothetical protein